MIPSVPGSSSPSSASVAYQATSASKLALTIAPAEPRIPSAGSTRLVRPFESGHLPDHPALVEPCGEAVALNRGQNELRRMHEDLELHTEAADSKIDYR